MQFVNYKIYSTILYIFLILIFCLCLIILLQILLINSYSNDCRFTYIIHLFVDILTMIFYIPITEILLIPIKCVNNRVYYVKNGEICLTYIHHLNMDLGILGSVLFFLWCIFMLSFNFYPFQRIESTIRVSPTNDTIIIIMKLILIIQYLLISDEYFSLAVLLLASIIIFFSCNYNSSYNNNNLEIAINIKNLLVLWSYFVLFISKIFLNFNANGFIYLLFIGYPFIIILSIINVKDKDFEEKNFSENTNNIKDFIRTIYFKIKLINSFIEGNKSLRNLDENQDQKNIILLKGFIKYHNLMCADEDCPLKKFIKLEGNYSIQRQYLLNYMNILFNKGFKKFENSINLHVIYIQFNYINRFNLNRVKTCLLKLKTLDCSIKDKYIIYCIEQHIRDNNINKYDYNSGNADNNDSQLDIIEQNYQKLKYLIENSIRLYVEFWGIFSANITSVLNTTSLYSLGGKLNILLNEISNLWDNELKNKKINIEHQYIAQLYSKFLSEILWDRKKSLEISNKLKYEILNNQLNFEKSDKEEKNKNTTIIDSLTNNQDLLLFCNYDEKGNYTIIQCSTSFSQLLAYQKYDIIGKPLEMIFPNVLIEEQLKYFEEFIKISSNGQNNNEEEFLTNEDNDLKKNMKLMIFKNSIGYILPLFASFKFLNYNDYSDTHIIKIKMEKKDSKSEYSYYILTNQDLIIENISLGAINLGLSLELLKNYVIKIDNLIRTENEKINLYENYNIYEEEQNKIQWIYPYLIYKKDNSNNKQIKEEDIEELIQRSKKKIFYVQIKGIKFMNNNYNGLVFLLKFNEIFSQKRKNLINNEFFIPKCDKNLIMFDLLNLKYIRAFIVDKKSGFRNLRDLENENEYQTDINNNKEQKIKKQKKTLMIEQGNDSSNSLEIKNNDVLLTKDKIIELQGSSCMEIKDFIFSLPILGTDISLERFMPNGDKYYASKITESLIKIQVIAFITKHNNKSKSNKLKQENKNDKRIFINNIESPKSSNTDNYLIKSNSPLSNELSNKNYDFGKQEINEELTTDLSSSLSTIFKSNTIIYIRYLIGFLFIEIVIFNLIQFIIVYRQIKKLKKKIYFLYNGYQIVNNLLLTKYFVTEGVLGNYLNISYAPVFYHNGLSNFVNSIVDGLAKNREEFTEIYDSLSSNDLCKEYQDFMNNTIINIYTLTLNKPENISILFNSGMTRIYSGINNLVYNPKLMVMNNRDTYELMHNIINEYYINCEKVINILFNDSIKATKLRLPLIIIIILYYISFFIITILFLKLLTKLSLDREKPINLFLTLKKKVFENLKFSAESFSNKILNKFFGNEENEEDSQQDYQSNIQPSDINIIKFKIKNESNYSIKKAFSFIQIIIIVFIFLIVYLLYFDFQYFIFRTKMDNIFLFINLLDKTNMAQIDYILSHDVFKSYLFNQSIPILNNKNTINEFIEKFLNMSNELEQTLIFTSKTNSFLGEGFKKIFALYYYSDFWSSYKEFFGDNNNHSESNQKIGIKPFQTRYQEIIRYYTIKYCSFSNILDKNDNISFILKERELKLFEINYMTEIVMKLLYKDVINLMLNSFDEYIDKSIIIFIVIFIVFITFSVLYYFIIWRIYQEKIYILLKNSSDLINLIPQEIKKTLIKMLNE